jgi:HK97 gp10 family phage protein
MAPRIDWFDKELIINVEKTTKRNIRKGCTLVARAARAKCPVGVIERDIAKTGKNAGKPWTARKPGTLKKSIRVRMSKGKKLSGQVIAGARSSKELTAYYAAIVEHGSSKTPAQPFLRPSLEANWEAVMDGFRNTL